MKREVEWAMALDACRPAIVLLPLLALVFGLVRGPNCGLGGGRGGGSGGG